ncbi:transglycosylase domain-containing protein [Caldalkalibacillus mannanilyticus]|uniref:transglycosylase domain-containing protein n=1 Tax=Caldalkalibacillus mannanilyticus TaxID=1418 RepID=UPI00046AA2AF|nr:transglycosylase domain-containing protein [Caldalkalibacillus mannanilyticus]
MDKKSSDHKPTNPAKPKRRKYILKTIWVVMQVFIVLGIMSFLFAGGVAAGFFAYNVKDEPLRSYTEIRERIHDYNKTGEAYFKNDEWIGYLLTSEVSQPVTVKEVSPHLIDAILATEDHIFYEHNGINFKAVSRAVLEQFIKSDEGTGGSTITQQLVKNQLLDPSRTFERKFKEMLLAMRIERMIDKNEILEAYMNIVYLGYNANGSNIEGVKAAAEGIFGVDVKELNIAQSAYIAGMIHSPGRYTPFQRGGGIAEERLKRGIDRQKFVLRRMLDTGRITAKQHEEALNFNLKTSLAEPTPGILEKYPYLTFEITDRAIEILAKQRLEEQGLARESLTNSEWSDYLEHARRELSRGGYKVHTTVDRELYEAFHEIVKDEKLFGPRSKVNKDTKVDPKTGEKTEQPFLEQAAATLIDNQTGAILAMVEGRDYDELNYNFTTTPRQPGSAIKPILDYAPALELGLVQPASIIDDAPIFKWDRSGGKYWVPKNWNNKYQGLVTARRAMDMSYNLPAIKTFLKVQEEAGPEVPFDYLRKMGITTIDPADLSAPSVSIGGMTRGLTVEETTSAFSTFANQGNYVKSYLIEKIETLEGKVIYEHEVQPVPVFSEQTAFLMNDMLRTVVSQGTATRVRRGMGSKISIAGKTGTTNNKFDYWFVGYTPQVSMGIWFGYPKPEELRGEYTARTQDLWVLLMKKAQELRPEYFNPELTFKMPDGIVKKTVCSKSGKLPSQLCKDAGFLVTDYFNRKYLPTQTDDSLIRGRVVYYNDKPYIAQDATPDDMVTEKVFVKRDPIDIPKQLLNQRARLLPADWDETAPQEVDPRVENGKVPDSPTAVKAVWTDGKLQITWTPSSEGDIAGYRVYRATKDGQFTKVQSIPNHLSKVYVDSSASQSQEFAYRVTTVDIAGKESEPSNVVISNQVDPNQFFTPDLTTPTIPKGLKGKHLGGGIELSWRANPDQDRVTQYHIYYTEDPMNGFWHLASTSSTSYVHTLTDSPKEVWYYVTAVNDAGESKDSEAIRVRIGESESETNSNDQGSSGSSQKKVRTNQQQEPQKRIPFSTPPTRQNEEDNLFEQLP